MVCRYFSFLSYIYNIIDNSNNFITIRTMGKIGCVLNAILLVCADCISIFSLILLTLDRSLPYCNQADLQNQETSSYDSCSTLGIGADPLFLHLLHRRLAVYCCARTFKNRLRCSLVGQGALDYFWDHHLLCCDFLWNDIRDICLLYHCNFLHYKKQSSQVSALKSTFQYEQIEIKLKRSASSLSIYTKNAKA